MFSLVYGRRVARIVEHPVKSFSCFCQRFCSFLNKSALEIRTSYLGVLNVPPMHFQSCKMPQASKYYSMFSSNDTVFALSSGHGKCGVAVIRATGPHAKEAMFKIARLNSPPDARRALFRRLSDPQSGETIDHGLILWFPGPQSFTGEDIVEFQIHGGTAVVVAVLKALSNIPGCRHADPGDFTKRAFFNNKLDLTEVEGLGDLIHAETEAQRKQALRQMEGDLGRLYHKWSKQLLSCVAHIEAIIDFGEDENIDEGLLDNVISNVSNVRTEIQHHLNDGRRGERLRSGVHVTIVGAPNSGKSSLLNILCQRPAAIVSPLAGTTRDVLETTLDIFGYPILISDTAGLRDSTDPIEQEGVRRALKRSETSDLKILIADSSLHVKKLNNTSWQSLPVPDIAKEFLGLNTDAESDWVYKATRVFNPGDTIIVLNKTDLLLSCETTSADSKCISEEVPVCWISCKTGEGIDQFMEQLKSLLEAMCGNPLAGNPSLTQARHREHLLLCSQDLERFLGLVSSNTSLDNVLDMVAEELRSSIRQLGKITGKVGVEEILDVVFSDFCIGK